MLCSSYFISSRVKKTRLAYFTDTLLKDNLNYAVMSFNSLFITSVLHVQMVTVML